MQDSVEELRKKSAAGDYNASTELALHYINSGEYIDILEEVICLLYNAAIKGRISSAAMALGKLYEKEFLSEVGNRRALYWYKKSCDLKDSLACTYISLIYQSGNLGVEIDLDKANYYSDLSANLLKDI